jgi:hypothetical protein
MNLHLTKEAVAVVVAAVSSPVVPRGGISRWFEPGSR